jgi:hypothetical protein
MPRPKPNKLHDELDALLDGRPVELTDELAPLAEAADALRSELAAYELDPAVADRHLERVLDGSGSVVQLPARPQPSGWDLRHRVAAVVLAAALVLAPATIASAAALPGQAMYPFKLAIEQLRIASVQWSPGREAGERTRVADTRRVEVVRLAKLRMFSQLPTAIKALTRAVQEAQAAVADAREQGELPGSVQQQLNVVAAQTKQALAIASNAAKSAPTVPKGIFDAIKEAVDQSPAALKPDDPPVDATPTPTTEATQPTNATGSTIGSTQSSASTSITTSTSESTTTTEATTTTTEATTTTSQATETTATPDSADDDKTGGAEQSPQQVPPTTVPGP